LIAGLLAGCAGTNQVRIGWSGAHRPGRIDYSYVTFTGKEVGSFRATVDQTITLNYTAIVNKGTLAVKVRNVQGQVLWQAEFEEEKIDSVQIPVERAGIYTVLIEGLDTGDGFGVTHVGGELVSNGSQS
jgi:hypothetical protein